MKVAFVKLDHVRDGACSVLTIYFNRPHPTLQLPDVATILPVPQGSCRGTLHAILWGLGPFGHSKDTRRDSLQASLGHCTPGILGDSRDQAKESGRDTGRGGKEHGTRKIWQPHTED